MSEYRATSSTGKLKLKGVKVSRVDKKKKKNKAPVSSNKPGQEFARDDSVVQKTHANTDDHLQQQDQGQDQPTILNRDAVTSEDGDEDGDIQEHLKTEAEKRHDEQRRKRLEERLKKEGVKTHKQRVEELNKYLSNLSEHHDMPKIGPG